MSVRLVPDTTPVTNDMVVDRAEQLRICKLFNTRYSQGIESPRRRHLLKLLQKALPLFEQIVLEAKAVETGERKRYGQAVDRMIRDEHVLPDDALIFDTVDHHTQEIWDCCESLTYEIGRECEWCGREERSFSCLDDDAAAIQELITLLTTGDQTGEDL